MNNTKAKYLHEIYTKEDIDLVSSVYRTYDCGYSPIVLCAPHQTIRCGNWLNYFLRHTLPVKIDTKCDYVYTLRLRYAIEVWQMALAAKKKKDVCRLPKMWGLKWQKNGYFNELVKSDCKWNKFSIDDYIPEFWNLLKLIADSGIIKVNQGLTTHSRSEDRFNEYDTKIYSQLVVDCDDLKEWVNKHNDGHFSLNSLNSEPRSYKWDEIKEFFIEITIPQIALLHGDRLNPCTDLDRKLINACTSFRIDDVRKYIEEGADVNAIDGVSGDTVIGETIDAIHYGDLSLEDIDRQTTEEHKAFVEENTKKAIEIIKLLIDNGADVNLYGFGVGSPLLQCIGKGMCGVEIMKFLLENGANPNVYTNYADAVEFGFHDRYVNSFVLYELYNEYDESEDNGEMIKLLKEYGAKEYIDGFDPKEYFK